MKLKLVTLIFDSVLLNSADAQLRGLLKKKKDNYKEEKIGKITAFKL